MPDTFQPDAALHPLLPADELRRFGIEPPHKHFTVSDTSYLRNLTRDDLRGECIAIHYERPPRRNENGSTTYSMIFPVLVMTEYLSDKRATAEKIARILEQHWDEDDG